MRFHSITQEWRFPLESYSMHAHTQLSAMCEHTSRADAQQAPSTGRPRASNSKANSHAEDFPINVKNSCENSNGVLHEPQQENTLRIHSHVSLGAVHGGILQLRHAPLNDLQSETEQEHEQQWREIMLRKAVHARASWAISQGKPYNSEVR